MDFLIRGADRLKERTGFRLVGRDAELQRLISTLMRSHANSVILVGAGGVGCTTLCLGMQEAKEKEDAPFDLIGKRLFWLDTNGLFSTDDITANFRKIVGRLKRTPESVLILDDTRDFVEACRNAGTLNFVNALTRMVETRECQLVLEVKDEDLDAVLRCHTDLRDLFTILPLEEPTGDVLASIAQATAETLALFHGIEVAHDAVTAALELTKRYHVPDAGLSRAQPERVTTLLDRALAAYRLDAHRNPPGFSEEGWAERQKLLKQFHANQRLGERKVTELEEEIDETLSRNVESKVTFEPSEVTAIRTKIRNVQDEVNDNRVKFDELTKEVNSKLKLTRDLVLAEFSRITDIPADKLDQDEIAKLRSLESAVKTRLFGQDEVVHRVVNGIKVSRVGRRNKDAPGAYLFLGPSGVGKTELAKTLASLLLDDEAALSRFDMSEYMEKHAVAKLIGAPPGYEGFEAGGILTNLMLKNSYRVLLFDEIEKAHPDVFNVFLQVLSDGRLTDNVGRTVTFGDAVVIFTTNSGQFHLLDPNLTESEANAAALTELDQTYRPEFLNRFAGRQNILCFQKLDLTAIGRIVTREIDSLDRAYTSRGVRVGMPPEPLTEFCRDHYDPRVGARGLPGYISANLEPVIVERILEGRSGVAAVDYNLKTHELEVKFS